MKAALFSGKSLQLSDYSNSESSLETRNDLKLQSVVQDLLPAKSFEFYYGIKQESWYIELGE